MEPISNHKLRLLERLDSDALSTRHNRIITRMGDMQSWVDKQIGRLEDQIVLANEMAESNGHDKDVMVKILERQEGKMNAKINMMKAWHNELEWVGERKQALENGSATLELLEPPTRNLPLIERVKEAIERDRMEEEIIKGAERELEALADLEQFGSSAESRPVESRPVESRPVKRRPRAGRARKAHRARFAESRGRVTGPGKIDTTRNGLLDDEDGGSFERERQKQERLESRRARQLREEGEKAIRESKAWARS